MAPTSASPSAAFAVQNQCNGEVPCDDVVRKLSALCAVLELACQHPDLKEELLQPFLRDDLLNPDSRDASPIRLEQNTSTSTSTAGTKQCAPDVAPATTVNDRVSPDLPMTFRPPPGLEDLVPMQSASQVAHNRSNAVDDLEAPPTPAIQQPATFRTVSAKELPPEGEERKQRQEVARRQTLVLAYLPRFATESHISAAVDSALGRKLCVARARIVRDSEGTSACYGFFEFANPALATDAFDACRRGQVVIDDASGHTWHLRASRANRATVRADAAARTGRRARGCRGGRANGPKSEANADI